MMFRSSSSVNRRTVVPFLGAVFLPFGAAAQTSTRPSELIGHWRTTIIVGDQPLDRNLVLRPDGSASRWTVTASRRDAPESGSWSVVGNTLLVTFAGSDQSQQAPYFFHKGQLVYPNIPNRRRFWDRV